MVGVLGLLTGWVLLLPALVTVYLLLGGQPFPLIWPIVTIAGSVPVLGFSTIAGIVVIFLSVRRLARRPEPLAPPH